MSRIDDLIAEYCPDGVEFRPIKEVAEVGTGNSDRKNATEGGQYPFYVRSKDVVRIDSFQFDETALVIPGEGGIGDIFHFVQGKYALHQRAYRIHFLDPSIEPKFAYYWFSSRFKAFIVARSVNATVSSIRKPMIEGFTLPVPPLEVQREIVRILDTFTALEAELEAELEARRVQYAHFHDAAFNVPSSEDVCWVSIADLAGEGFFRDGDWVESKDQDPEGDVRLTQLADVGVGVFRDRSNRWMNNEQASRLGCTYLIPGDILIARMPDPLGRACQVPGNIGQAVTVVDVAILRSMRPDVLPRYVMYAINSSQIRRKMLAFQTGGTRQRISRTNLGTLTIPIPSLAEQERIVSVLDSFDALVNDLSIGLPAELDARRQQYEYYRDQLLTFKEVPA